jgi:hypothetical protein
MTFEHELGQGNRSVELFPQKYSIAQLSYFVNHFSFSKTMTDLLS